MTGGIIFIIIILSSVSSCSFSRSQSSPSLAKTSPSSVPEFDHIVVIAFENKEYNKVIGNPFMPSYNRYAQKYTLLTQFYAVAHPSLPNYLAMIGGDTFNIGENCSDCFVDARSLPDLIESSGRTWKTYQEDMQTTCALGSQDESENVQKHNPFVYFNAIRLDEERCKTRVVPLKQLSKDIASGVLRNYIFITPNMCHNAHDCQLYKADQWLRQILEQLLPALEKDGSNYLVVLNWDEGQDHGSCCGFPQEAGGRISVVLISPLVKSHFQDATPYSHYSLLKTISKAWDITKDPTPAVRLHMLMCTCTKPCATPPDAGWARGYRMASKKRCT